MQLTPRLSAALEDAFARADDEPLGEQALLLAVLRSGPGVAVRVLLQHGADIAACIQRVTDDSGPEATRLRERAEELLRGWGGTNLPDADPVSPGQIPTLDRLGVDLTAQARAGALMPVFGRDDVYTEIARALIQEGRHVPVLAGPPGVGKTAIVHGFAARLVDTSRPLRDASLAQLRIIALDVSALVAETSLRGEFEARINRLVSECAAHPDIVLFIDEMHTLLGAGKAHGELDAAQMLKPAMAAGTLRVIGATTPDEYSGITRRDPAFERRLQPIQVADLAPDATEDLLRADRERREQRMHVAISDDALHAAVELSIRYLPQHHLPDKAVNLLNTACARKRIGSRLTALEGALQELVIPTVDAADVLSALAEQLRIPLDVLQHDQRRILLSLEKRLSERIKGQDPALQIIAETVRAGWSQLRDPEKPRAVMLFGGPTGVGKTETARTLADLLFGTLAVERYKIIDMGAFGEAHLVAQSDRLTSRFRGFRSERRPHALAARASL